MYKLFSQRKKEAMGEIPEIYEYNSFPESFRNQYVFIVSDVFEKANRSNSYYGRTDDLWNITCELYAREKGLKGIAGDYYTSYNNKSAYKDYVDKCSDSDFLDLLDFTVTHILCSEVTKRCVGNEVINQAIFELNYRFDQHSLGYEVINGEVITKTDKHIHTNIVKPALILLHQKEFNGAENEFMLAWKHYKETHYKDAILNAGKAFESVMKSICKYMSFSYDEQRDDAKKLIQILRDNDFFPAYLESHMNGVRTTLESGVPTVRNKTSGHGQGDEIIDVSETFASYALNLTATNIVFLCRLYGERRKAK